MMYNHTATPIGTNKQPNQVQCSGEVEVISCIPPVSVTVKVGRVSVI